MEDLRAMMGMWRRMLRVMRAMGSLGRGRVALVDPLLVWVALGSRGTGEDIVDCSCEEGGEVGWWVFVRAMGRGGVFWVGNVLEEREAFHM